MDQVPNWLAAAVDAAGMATAYNADDWAVDNPAPASIPPTRPESPVFAH